MVLRYFLLNLIFLSLLLNSQSFLFAECYYSDFELKFEITTSGDEKMICYKSVSTCDFDTNFRDDQDYLFRTLKLHNESNKISVFKNRFKYDYCYNDTVDCATGLNHSVYNLFEPLVFQYEEVKVIKLINYIQVSSTEGISNKVSVSDTSWMSSQAQKVISISAYLCDHSISVFELNSKTNYMIEKVKDFNRELRNREEEVDDECDALAWKFLEEFSFLEKIVIVSSCTD